MIKLLIVFLLISQLVGCSQYAHPLNDGDKAKFVRELIPENTKCITYRSKLSSPTIDDIAIDKIYRDAMKSGCINKDV
jgi:hypothetical protein